VLGFGLVLCLAGITNLTRADELSTAAAVRGLTSKQAPEQIRVRLRGVVTFYDDKMYSRFIQDDTAGIYLQASTNSPALFPGQFVEIEGVSSPGEFAPVVLVKKVQLLGEAPLPTPKQVNYEQLATGVEDSQFVEITGIVRSVRPVENTSYFHLEITTGGGRLSVFAKNLPVANPEELLDSTVRVRGVCSTQFNHQRQLFAIRLMVPRADDLKIEVPAADNPFTAAAQPIGSLLQFTPQGSYGHRVKLAGTVIYFDPGADLFLQDGAHGMEVQTKQRLPLALGDKVETLGFVRQGDYTPLMQDAIYRKISTGTPVAPVRLTTDEALKGGHDCQLIQIAARLIDRTQHGTEQFLILQESNFIFQASLKQAEAEESLALPANGSRVAVTGVCRIDPGTWEAGENWRAKSFVVLLRSTNDVALLEAPSWWTLGKMLWIAGGLAFAVLAAFAWIAVLRRQVAERTRELEIQIQKRQLAERRREIEQERARVAHDLHDDLGSRLTEVNMLATLVKSPITSAVEKDNYLTELTETARQMVTSLDEIVWAVNPRNDTIASLASYFGSYAQRLLDLAGIACGLNIAEDLPEHPLGTKFRQEVFLAFKEALNNVIRHAGAKQVWLRISVRAGSLVVEVSDNGHGIDPRQRQVGEDGIANMDERMKSLGGVCEVISDAQNGTTIQFRAPLPKIYL
jgi:signal transduction histidine kinase